MFTRRQLLKQTAAAGAVVSAPMLRASAADTNCTPKAPTEKNELQIALEEALTRNPVPGASVAIYNKGQLTTAAAGLTNVATGVELTPDTVMHIGSIAKVFTTTLVMQLVDEGKVDLDAKVLHYLPDLKLHDRAALEQITVKMLLNHTSGIDGELSPDYGHDEETIEKGVARMVRFGQVHRPGAEFSYCNAAVVIAGYLAQRLRNKSWYTLIKERIYQPLQMEHAVTLPEEALLYRASVGHFMNPASKQVMRTSNAFNPLSRAPCGPTLMMSAQDLMTFARAHMRLGAGINGTRILSEDAARAMQRVTVNNQGKGYASDLDLGLGWMISSSGLLQHSGAAPGAVAWLGVHPERDFAAAILMNFGNGADLFKELMQPRLKEVGFGDAVITSELQLPTQPVRIDPARYVGEYENVVVRARVVQATDGLTLSYQAKFRANADDSSLEPSPPVPLIALGEDKFVPKSRTGKNVTGEIVAFRNVRSDGRMEHLGNWSRLYRRHTA